MITIFLSVKSISALSIKHKTARPKRQDSSVIIDKIADQGDIEPVNASQGRPVMNSSRIDRFSLKVTEGKKSFLGFDTGIGNRNFTGVNTRDLRAVPGLLVPPEGSGKPLEDWEISELREIDGNVVMLGPWKPGRCFDPDKDADVSVFRRIGAVLAPLAEKGRSPDVLGPASLYLCDDGSVIVFPPLVVNFILLQMPEADKMNFRERYAHPRFRGAKGLSWSLGVLVYRALTGTFPFIGKDRAEIHDRIRDGEFLPAADAAVGLKPALGRFVDSVLGENEPDQLPEPEDWVSFIDKWVSEGAFNPLDEKEKEAGRIRIEQGKKRIDRRFGLKRNLSTRGFTYLIIGLVVLVVFVIAGTFIYSATRPPLTRGMSEDQVIRAFYRGINEIDFPLVMDCLGPDAESEDAATVKQEHIMAIQRTKQFGDSGIIRAEDWLAAEQPPIPPFKILFGLTGFTYDKTGDGRHKVTYTRWYTDLSGGMETSAGSVNQTVTLTGLKVTDLLTMKLNGKDWEIARIERTTEPFYSREVRWSEGGSIFKEEELGKGWE
jgi:hypothetical protein